MQRIALLLALLALARCGAVIDLGPERALTDTTTTAPVQISQGEADAMLLKRRK